jgi:type II secretory pathway pseudopilin PulG
MWSMRQERNGTAGFSLTEALVALAIAAFLAAVLTRFVSATRVNALKVREAVAMDILSDSLLERLVARELQPGRTDGRSGALGWHIDVVPIAFYARARAVSEKKKPNTAAGTQPGGPGLAPALNQNAVAKSQPAVTWVPYRVTAVIRASSGPSHAIDTFRIVPQQAEQRPDQPEQR